MTDKTADTARETLAQASRTPAYRKVRRAEPVPGGTPTE